MALLRNLISFVLLAVSFSAFAVTSYNAQVIGWRFAGTAPPWHASAAAGCASGSATVCSNKWSYPATGAVISKTYCGWPVAPSTTCDSWGNAVEEVVACTQGGTFDAATRICNSAPDCVAPQTRNSATGLCESPPDPCISKSQQAPTYSWFKSAVGAPTPDGQTYCDSGCTAAVNPAPTGTSYNNTQYKLQRYEVVYLPVSCTSGTALPSTAPDAVPPPEPPKKPVCAVTEGVLTTSSGTIACVPPGVESSNTPTVRKETKTETYPDGSTKKTDTTYTKDPASQVQDTQQTITTTPATGGGAGMAGTPGTTASSGSTQPSSSTDPDASDFCQKNGQLQICKGDMNLESTQKEVRDYIKSLTDPGSTPYTGIENAKQSTQSDAELQAEIDKFTAASNGTFSPDASSKSSWDSAMSSGWFDPVTRVGCTPYTAQIGGRTWTLDICPTAEKVSVISEYVIWFLLVVGIFVMFTGGAIQRSN